jgi:hypothetical protein
MTIIFGFASASEKSLSHGASECGVFWDARFLIVDLEKLSSYWRVVLKSAMNAEMSSSVRNMLAQPPPNMFQLSVSNYYPIPMLELQMVYVVSISAMLLNT